MLVVIFKKRGHHGSEGFVGVWTPCEYSYCRVCVLAAREYSVSKCASISISLTCKLLPEVTGQDFGKQRPLLTLLEHRVAHYVLWDL